MLLRARVAMKTRKIRKPHRLRFPVVAVCSILFLAQTSAHAGDDQMAPVIDNNRVTVFDVTLNPGKPWTAPKDIDFAEMILVGGKIRSTTPDGKSSTAARKSGAVIYVTRGTVAAIEASSKDPSRVVIVELKGPDVPPLPNKSGYPLAFPRPGAIKVFENNRVIAWNSTWRHGVPIPVHYHDKDIVIVFRDSGSIKSTQLNGESTVGDNEFGTTRFSKSNRIHSEELISGKGSAIVLELKQ